MGQITKNRQILSTFLSVHKSGWSQIPLLYRVWSIFILLKTVFILCYFYFCKIYFHQSLGKTNKAHKNAHCVTVFQFYTTIDNLEKKVSKFWYDNAAFFEQNKTGYGKSFLYVNNKSSIPHLLCLTSFWDVIYQFLWYKNNNLVLVG